MSVMDIHLNHSRKSIGKRWMEKSRRFLSFFREVKEELRKVSWTTREELIFATKMVVSMTFFFGMGIYLVDLGIKGSLDGFAMMIRYIFS